MTKAGMAEMLDRLEQRLEERKPKTIDELRAHADEAVKIALHGCGSDGHAELHDAVTALFKVSFKFDLLPDRIRENFIRWMVCEVTHGLPEGHTLGGNLKEAIDGHHMAQAIHLAYFVAALYDRPDLVTPSTVKPPSTGNYL